MAVNASNVECFQVLWNKLPHGDQITAARTLWQYSSYELKDRVARQLGKKLNTRPKAIFSQPLDLRAKRLASCSDLPDRTYEDLLRAHFFHRHKEMMTHFLDQLKIPHTDCQVDHHELEGMRVPKPEETFLAAEDLCVSFPIRDALLYLEVLQLQNGESWPGIRGLDLSFLAEQAQAKRSSGLLSKGKKPNTVEQTAPDPKPSVNAEGISALTEQFKRAAADLAKAANQLSLGELPDPLAADVVDGCRANFAQTRSQIAKELHALGSHIQEEALNDLASLSEAFEKLEIERSARREKARNRGRDLEIIRSVLSLERGDGSSFQPLAALQESATAMKSRWSSGEETVEDQTTLRAFALVLGWIDGELDASEDSGPTNLAFVAEHFGLPLALAAIQKQLIRTSRQEQDKLGGEGQGLTLYGTAESAELEPALSVSAENDQVATRAVHLETYDKTTELSIEAGEGYTEDDQEEIERSGTLTGIGTPSLEDTDTGSSGPKREETGPLSVEIQSELDEEVTSHASDQYETCKEFAQSVLSNNTAPLKRVDAARFSICLAHEGEAGFAFQLAALKADQQLASILKAVLLGSQVRDQNGPIAQELSVIFSELDSSSLFQSDSDEYVRAMRFLLCAASLPAAMLAPNTGACDIFKRINFESGFRYLWESGNSIVEYAQECRSLDISILSLACNDAEWNQKLLVLQSQVEEWYRTAASKRFIFGPAADVWRQWLDTDQLIHRLLTPVRNNDASRLTECRQELTRLTSSSNVRQEIEHTDRQILYRHGSSITAKAFGQLTRRLQQEVLAFLADWISLQSASPAHPDDYQFKRTNVLRSTILGRSDDVLKELDAFRARSDAPSIVSWAADSCRSAFCQVYDLLQRPASLKELPIRYLLNACWLKVPNVTLNEDWFPEDPDGEKLSLKILASLAEPDQSWLHALKIRSRVDQDHQATGRIIEYLEALHEKEVDLDDMRDFRRNELEKSQEAFARDLESTRNAVEYGITLGVVGDSERNEILGHIDAVAINTRSSERYGTGFEDLKEIRNQLAEKRTGAIETARKRLDRSPISPQSSWHKKICEVLDAGDPVTATEYMDRALEGDELPPFETTSDRLREFLDCHRGLFGYLNKASDSEVLESIRSATGLSGLESRRLEERQREEVSAVVETWYTAKRQARTRASAKECAAIFRMLGFDVLTVDEHPTESPKRTWFTVHTNVIGDRERCPVALYGSTASGRYRVLSLKGEPPEEEILNSSGSSQGLATIVLYFGLLSTEQRQNLTRLCRTQHKTLLVIDDLLLLWLCTERPPRMSLFFELTLPFTYLEPYAPTAGLVAPEMFYGRQRERESVLSPLGSCFIYGGRQLGKTALLRSVERNSHDLSEGRFVCWIDLKAHGLGFNRSIDEIWPLLTKAIREKDGEIIPSKFSSHADPDKLFSHIQQWLNGDQKRRMLILLDESDRFLESDSTNDFLLVSKLKAWMDSSERRFKVVLAGLHNVQRTTRQANNPLAHFQDPICIGPLLENGEWREARDLVKKPLEAMGFRFASPDLVTRILSQTNYYPSLIQIYCNQLLRFFAKEKYSAFQQAPYEITGKHIEEAYKSQRLRSDIRDRLRWTLDLDKRYRVITYAIAFAAATSDGVEDGVDTGHSVSWIRDQALTIWRKGFQESQSVDEISSLLAEMVGLGILRENKGHLGHFSLRSSNVMNLLGTVEEIFGELEAAARWEPEPSYEREKFRNGIPNDPIRRNPLTAAQDSEIRAARNGVAIIVGTEAAGLDDVPDFLRNAVGQKFFQRLSDGTGSRNEYQSRLASLNKREMDAPTIAYVNSDAHWDESWVEEATTRISRLRPNRNYVRAVFAADAHIAWYLTEPSASSKLSRLEIKLQSLGPWHRSAIQQWLDSCELANSSIRDRITDITGGWPTLLYRLLQLSNELGSPVEALGRLDRELHDEVTLRRIEERFGLCIAEPRKMLLALSEYGEALAEEEIEFLIEPRMPSDLIKRSIAWADSLRLINAVGQGCWQVDPIVDRLLRFGKKK